VTRSGAPAPTGGPRVLLLEVSATAPCLLPPAAWRLLSEADVCTLEPELPVLAGLAEAGIPVHQLPDGEPLAEQLRARAEEFGTVVHLASVGGPAPAGLATERVDVSSARGLRLLDVVAVMDRLRSPGGCPWDAEQTHESLAPYLLEEAYEAYQAIEDADRPALREELGDVLLQVLFHARLAEEAVAADRWSIDDVAAGLLRKLVRRHPHVFGEVLVADASDVSRNWETIKAAEKNRRSVTEGVALSQPALTLAATLQRRAAGVGVPPGLVSERIAATETLEQAVAMLAESLAERAEPAEVGELLFVTVALALAHGVDPEAALRARCRRFRDQLAAVEHGVRAAGEDPAALDARQWSDRWFRSG
jgi:XTP/dITP diphosphohydrolase